MEHSFSFLYSYYYDLLYKEKDYKKESDQINTLIKRYHPGAKSILNIGCGTGSHDILLAQKGYDITGIDSSNAMLSIANAKKDSAGIKNVDFLCKDIRQSIFEKNFDAAISLFHVTSYLIKKEDVLLAFQNIYDSLKENGVLIFDFWYAPGILANLPKARTKLIEENNTYIDRTSNPTIDFENNTVDIRFTLKVKNIGQETFDSSTEMHKVRYFFIEEMEKLLNSVGFKMLDSGSDYELNPFKQEDRYSTIVAIK